MFKNSKRNGEGTYISDRGEKTSGIWKDNEFIKDSKVKLLN